MDAFTYPRTSSCLAITQWTPCLRLVMRSSPGDTPVGVVSLVVSFA